MINRTYINIDLNALENNFNAVKTLIPDNVKLLGVIKADAYGHGAVEFAEFFDGRFDFFGVACIEEAMELKMAGIKTPVLVLGKVFPCHYELIVKYDIRIPVFSIEEAKLLSTEAVRQNKTVPFHFCIDTGMSRIGLQVTEYSADICKKITEMPNLYAEGLFSHYATADEKDLSKAELQLDKYKKFIEMLKNRNVNIPVKHLSNSAGIMSFNDYFDMCRMGIVAYGLYPSHEVDKTKLDIKPVMSWYSAISYLKTVDKGVSVSYGGTYVTDKITRIATIPVGYADGYPRSLSNIGKVIINGQYAPVIGRICMDQFMVDVTYIDCLVGDEVVLIGKQQDKELTMDEVSELSGTICYELPCRISKRITKVYTYNNQIVKKVNKIYNY